jgi:hypothetical protein
LIYCRIKTIIYLSRPLKGHSNLSLTSHLDCRATDALHYSTKPFFIFQGVRDDYGGTDVREKYKLPKNVELSFFETDHGFMDISTGEAIRMKEKALAILTEF